MLDQLVDKDGNILVEGIYDEVAELTKEEEDRFENIWNNIRSRSFYFRYKTINFDVEKYKSEIGVNSIVQGEDKIKTLMARYDF